MTTEMLIVAGLGGATSNYLATGAYALGGGTFSTTLFALEPTPSHADVDEFARIRSDALSRLAELREQAARRQRNMPTYEDSAKIAAERADCVAGMRDLQLRTRSWTGED